MGSALVHIPLGVGYHFEVDIWLGVVARKVPRGGRREVGGELGKSARVYHRNEVVSNALEFRTYELLDLLEISKTVGWTMRTESRTKIALDLSR